MGSLTNRRKLAGVLVGVLTAGILTVAGAPPALGATYTVNVSFEFISGNNTPGCDGTECSLREAVEAAEANPGADEIVIAPGVNPRLTRGQQLTITTPITIRGQGAEATTVQIAADGTQPSEPKRPSRFFAVTATGSLNLHDLTLTGGKAPDGNVGVSDGTPGANGGAIVNLGIVTITSATLTGNAAGDGGGANNEGPGRAGGNGGAVFNDGTLIIRSSTLSGNRAGEGGQGNDADAGDGGRGGAIFNSGNLSISSSTLSGNHAGAGGASLDLGGSGTPLSGTGGDGGAVASTGSIASITTSTLSGNDAGDGGTVFGSSGNGGNGGEGGAVSNSASLSVSLSTLSGNDAGRGGGGSNALNWGGGGDGGAISNSGEIDVLRSTLSGNFAGRRGSGIAGTGDDGSGGGISSTGSMDVTLSTIYDNRTGFQPASGEGTGSGGGIFWASEDDGTIDSSTIAQNLAVGGNSGGIATQDVGGELTLTNTLMGDKCHFADADDVVDGGGNLDNGTSCNFGIGSLSNADPGFASPSGQAVLDDNGGLTQTVAITAGDAKDAPLADANCQPIDQRGVVRPVGLNCDIGAYEDAGVPQTTQPSKESDSNDGSCDIGDCSLREAVAAAHVLPGDDVIPLFGRAYNMRLGQLEVTDSLGSITFQGPGTIWLALSGDQTRLLSIAGGATVFIDQVTLTGGRAPDGDAETSQSGDNGGAISNAGDLTITNSTLYGNTAGDGGSGAANGGRGGDGGAVANSGDLTIVNSTLSGNTAGDGGDGTSADGAPGRAGAIDNVNNLAIYNSTLTGNAAGTGFVSGTGVTTGEGGAVRTASGTGDVVEIHSSILAGNTAASGPDCAGTVDASSSFNLLGVAGCGIDGTTNDNQAGTSGSPLDAGLGARAGNGGTTQTHELLPGSPAIGAGDNPLTLNFDQRGAGFPRTQESQTDVGSYESNVPADVSELSITKSPPEQTVASGGDATFEITVTNHQMDSFLEATVTDEAVPACNQHIVGLDQEEPYTYTCTASGVTEDFTNTATVSGRTQVNEFSASSNVVFVDVVNPSVSISKTPPSQTIAAGEDAQFTITVTNTGDAALENATVEDVTVPACDKAIGDLAVGGEHTYTCTVADVQEDFTNTAAVSATEPGTGTEVSDTSETVTVEVLAPELSITKSPETQTIAPGGDAEFEITVTNTGDVDLESVSVEDALVPDCDEPIGNLAAGAEYAYTCTATDVQQEFTNTATVNGIEPDSQSTVTANSNEAVVELIECTVSGSGSITGTSGNDVICGSDGNDTIYGQGGHDILIGGGGSDRIYGGSGRDQIFGGEGSDYLYGQDGRDDLFGEGGNDRLYGGNHDDDLDGGPNSDTCYGQSGTDTRTSCESGSG